MPEPLGEALDDLFDALDDMSEAVEAVDFAIKRLRALLPGVACNPRNKETTT